MIRLSTTAPLALAVAVLLSPITSTGGESTTEIARPVSHDTDFAQSDDDERDRDRTRATPSPSPSASRSAEPAGSPAPIRRAAPSPSPTPVAVRQQAARVTTSPAAAPPQSGATTADTTTQDRPGPRSAPDLAVGIAARSGSASTRGGEERPSQQPPTAPGAVDPAQRAAPVPADASSFDPERSPATGPAERGAVEASALVRTASRQRTIALLPWLLAALVVGVAVALADRRRRT